MKMLLKVIFFTTVLTMADAKFNNTITNFSWLNEPKEWSLKENNLEFVTENNTDFWQQTYYNFNHNSGHVFGVDLEDDFTMTACIEANFTSLYDQAGLMIYIDEKHWIKAGIEYTDGNPMIGSVVTNEISDWGTGVFTGNPRQFYLRLSKVKDVVCIKYSTDDMTWTLLRLAPFPIAKKYFAGPMACTPTRQGLRVKFSQINITEPADDILHSN